jgi:excinuclease ABC subunit B
VWNERNGITPKGIIKRVKDMIEGAYDPEQMHSQLKAAQDEARYGSMSEKQLAREIRQLEKQMLEHARNLEFEKAAQARDRLAALKKSVFGAVHEDEEPEPRKAA